GTGDVEAVDVASAARVGRGPDFVRAVLALSPLHQPHWNSARQRHCRPSKRYQNIPASLPTRSPSHPRKPARIAGFSTFESGCRSRNSHKAANSIRSRDGTRTHSDAQVAAIAASIKEWGWTTPVLVGGELKR